MLNYSVERDFAGNLSWLSDFYFARGYGGVVKSEDEVCFLRHAEDPIAVVRLAEEEGVMVLRGMQVVPDYQGHGIGTRLLLGLVDAIPDRSCYCLPYAHLEAFYGSGGFVRLDSEQIPQFLRERLQSYLRRGMDVIAMGRIIS